MKFLLDTHAALWALADDDRLGREARALLVEARSDSVAISDISLLEIALLADRGRIIVSGSVHQLLAEAASAFRVLPINPAIAAKAMTLPLDQPDPFDRVIAATAWHHELLLLTRDRRLAQCTEITTGW